MTSFSTRFADENTRKQYVPECLLLPGDYRAPEREFATELAERDTVAIRASGLGEFPGTQIIDALHRVRGELGHPHLPFLPELPERGWQSTTLARTIATLSGMELEGASYGWRLVHARGGGTRESARARSCYVSDINALADVVGGESSGASAPEDAAPSFKIQLCGPYTLAARVYAPNGERAISDAGAARDIRDAFLEGLGESISLIRQALNQPEARLTVQLDEPELGRIISGTIPTVSGFRTIPAVPVSEIYESYRICANTFAELTITPMLNLTKVPLTYPDDRTSNLSSVADACAIARTFSTADNPAELLFDPDEASQNLIQAQPLSDPHRWEIAAAVLESGARLWLPIVESDAIPQQAQRLWRLWNDVGLQKTEIRSVGLTHRANTTHINPHEATLQMARTTEYARIVAEMAAEGLG